MSDALKCVCLHMLRMSSQDHSELMWCAQAIFARVFNLAMTELLLGQST
jgi:hypothetical protein